MKLLLKINKKKKQFSFSLSRIKCDKKAEINEKLKQITIEKNRLKLLGKPIQNSVKVLAVNQIPSLRLLKSPSKTLPTTEPSKTSEIEKITIVTEAAIVSSNDEKPQSAAIEKPSKDMDVEIDPTKPEQKVDADDSQQQIQVKRIFM